MTHHHGLLRKLERKYLFSYVIIEIDNDILTIFL